MGAVALTALFPGQGSQFVGMGEALHRADPEARSLFERADEALGFRLSEICFRGPEAELVLTRNTQPAILVHSCAVWAVLAARDFRLQAAAGHSLGEYSAYVAAGALEFEDAVRLVRRRGELMYDSGQARPGAMAAVMGLPPRDVEDVCRQAAPAGVVVTANLNSPDQVVISGDPAAVERAMSLATARGAKRAVSLPVSGAFHSPLMEPAAEGLKAALAEVPLRDAAVPVVANCSARPVTTAAEIRASLERQLTAPVRWEESMRWLAANAGPGFVEPGPGRVLKGLARSIDRGIRVESIDGPEGIEAFAAGRPGGGS